MTKLKSPPGEKKAKKSTLNYGMNASAYQQSWMDGDTQAGPTPTVEERANYNVRDVFPGPINVRQYIYDIMGGKAPITEKSLSASELAELREVASTVKNKQIDYPNYTKAGGTNIDESSLIQKVTNPNDILRSTLGTAQLKSEGANYHITDKFNYNGKGKVEPDWTSGYDILRKLGYYLGSKGSTESGKDNAGSSVDIVIPKKETFKYGGDLKPNKGTVANTGDPTKHANYFVNNLKFLSNDEKTHLKKASELTGISQETIWTNMMAEGMDIYFADRQKDNHLKSIENDKFLLDDNGTTANQKYKNVKTLEDGNLSGFQYFGFDTLGDKIAGLKKKGYLPNETSFTTSTSFNEKEERVNTANPRNLSDAIYLTGADLKDRREEILNYATKNNINLSPASQDFFNYVGYNVGMGNAQKMMKSYNDSGFLANDEYLKTKPSESWDDPYTYAQRRIKNQQELQNGHFLTPEEVTQQEVKPTETVPQFGLGTGMSGLIGLMGSFGSMLGDMKPDTEIQAGNVNNWSFPSEVTGVPATGPTNPNQIESQLADPNTNVGNPTPATPQAAPNKTNKAITDIAGGMLNGGPAGMVGAAANIVGEGIMKTIADRKMTNFERLGMAKPRYGMGTDNLNPGVGTGEVTSLQGDMHSDPSGGIDMNGGKVEGGEVKVKKEDSSDIIFSKHLSKDGKRSFSQEAASIEKQFKNYAKHDIYVAEAKMQKMNKLDKEQLFVQKQMGIEVGKMFGFGSGFDGLLNNAGNLAYLLSEGQNYDKVDYGTIKPTHVQDNVSDQVISSSYNNERETLRNLGNMSGSRLRANLSALGNAEAMSRAKVKTDIANTNVGFDNQFGMFNQQNKMQGMMDEAANKGQMKSNYWAAITKMGENTAGTAKDAKADKSQQYMLELLKALYPDGLDKIE